MKRWLGSAVVAVVSCACFGTVGAGATASSAAPTPRRHVGPGRYVTLPYRGSHTPAQRLAQAAAGATVPMFSHTQSFANRSWTYKMVGKDPFTAGSGTTTVDTPIVPIKLSFTIAGVSNDPTATDSGCSQPRSAVDSMLQSPTFTNHPWTFGGKSVGTTQYGDAFRRANFSTQTKAGGINPNYHLLLNPQVQPLRTASVGGNSTQAGASCGTLGFVSISSLDNYIQKTLFPALKAHVSPTTFPLFVIYNAVLVDDQGGCCILGYHSAFDNPDFGGAVQTYGISGYQTTGDFAAGVADDVSTLTHEVSEWTDDPTVDSPTPPWGHIGQVSGCQNNLEVGDPLSGTVIPTVMPNGMTYHPQEMAFASWFYREPTSTGVNGWYSNNGTFTTAPPVCDTAFAPTGITAVGGNHQARLTWTAPYKTDPPITGYRITPFADGLGGPSQLFSSLATTQTVLGLTDGVSYRFRLQAVNAKGNGLTSGPTSAVVPPFPTATGFIDRQTQDFLGHAASASEISAELGQLNTDKSATAFVTSLRRGTDGTANVDPVTRLYFAYFLRIPDVGGLSHWIGKKRTGTLLTAISDAFAGSQEFKNRYGSLTNRNFVKLVYQNVLGRPADQAGEDFWTGKLDQKKATRGGVMVGFSESNEYKTKKAPAVDVAVTWIDMLGASPDQASFNTWVTNLTTGGKTVADLAKLLFGDARYATRPGL